MTTIRSCIGLGEFRTALSLLFLSVCSVSVIAGVLEPEIKALRTGSLDHHQHRLELGALNKSPTSTSLHHCLPSTSSAAAVHPLAGSNLGSGSKFGSIRNIKVSSTLIRAVHYPRNSREQVVREYFGRPLNRFLPHLVTESYEAGGVGGSCSPEPYTLRRVGGGAGTRVLSPSNRRSGGTVIDFLKRGKCDIVIQCPVKWEQ